MSHYGAFEGDVEDLNVRSKQSRKVVGLGLVFVAACVGVVAVTSFRTGWATPKFGVFMTLPKESAAQGQLCAPWPEFCLEQPKCLARYHGGNAANPVTNDPGLLTQYYGDCVSYCTECDCPGNFYCSKLQYAFEDTTSKLTPTEWYPGIAETLHCAGYEGTGVGSDADGYPIAPEDPEDSPLVACGGGGVVSAVSCCRDQ